MSRASRIIEKMEKLKNHGVIVDYVRMGRKWLVHLDPGKDQYLSHAEAEAFFVGASQALQVKK